MPGRSRYLREVFPLEFVHLSGFLTLLIEFTLAVSSFNIYKRKRRAFQVVLLASVTLTNTSHGRMAWTSTVSTNGGGNWLSVSPSAGLLPGMNVYEWAALGMTVSPGSLPAGVSYGTITIRAPGDALSPPADNTPQLIKVALTVGSAGPAPGIGLSPSALSLEAVAGVIVSAAPSSAEPEQRSACWAGPAGSIREPTPDA